MSYPNSNIDNKILEEKQDKKKQTIIFDEVTTTNKNNNLAPDCISYGTVYSLMTLLKGIEKLLRLKIDFDTGDLGSIRSNNEAIFQKKLTIEFSFINQFTTDNLELLASNKLTDEKLLKELDQALILRFRKIIIIKYQDGLDGNDINLLIKKELDKYIPKINKSFEVYKQYILETLTFTVDID